MLFIYDTTDPRKAWPRESGALTCQFSALSPASAGMPYVTGAAVKK